MADDQVLSEAMDVFDQTMGNQGQQSPAASGMPEDSYGDSEILGQTAGNSMPGTQSGSEGSGQDQAAGMDFPLEPGGGDSGGEYSASDEYGVSGSGGFGQEATAAEAGEETGAGGAMGQDRTTAYGTEGAGGMGQDESYGSAAGTGGGQTGTYDSGGYPSGTGAGQEAGNSPGSRGYGGSSGGAMTHAEQVAVLEGKLDEQLSDFDGMILGERRDVSSERDENAGQSGRYGPGGSGDGEGPGGGAGEGEEGTAPLLTAMSRGSTNSNAGGGMMPNLPEANRKGDFGSDSAQQSNIPADIPDGSDDDVVARQLREAAMKETDPVLREKLWDEYRKYKKGVALKR